LPVPTRGAWKMRSAEWLNLACVDDALAKRSLHRYFTDDAAASRAALAMFVARYCGERHITKRDVKIEFEIADDKTAKLDAKKLEAKWGPDGALCVSRPRMMYLDGATPKIPSGSNNQDDVATVCSDCTTPNAWLEHLRDCAFGSGEAPKTPIPTC